MADFRGGRYSVRGINSGRYAELILALFRADVWLAVVNVLSPVPSWIVSYGFGFTPNYAVFLKVNGQTR